MKATHGLIQDKTTPSKGINQPSSYFTHQNPGLTFINLHFLHESTQRSCCWSMTQVCPWIWQCQSSPCNPLEHCLPWICIFSPPLSQRASNSSDIRPIVFLAFTIHVHLFCPLGLITWMHIGCYCGRKTWTGHEIHWSSGFLMLCLLCSQENSWRAWVRF